MNAAQKLGESIAEVLDEIIQEKINEEISADNIEGLEAFIDSSIDSSINNGVFGVDAISGLEDSICESIEDYLKNVDIPITTDQVEGLEDKIAEGAVAAIDSFLDGDRFQEAVGKAVKSCLTKLFMGALGIQQEPRPESILPIRVNQEGGIIQETQNGQNN